MRSGSRTASIASSSGGSTRSASPASKSQSDELSDLQLAWIAILEIDKSDLRVYNSSKLDLSLKFIY